MTQLRIVLFHFLFFFFLFLDLWEIQRLGLRFASVSIFERSKGDIFSTICRCYILIVGAILTDGRILFACSVYFVF